MSNKNSTHPLHYSIYTRSCAKDIFSLLESKPNDRLLDVGCGVGYYLERLMHSTKSVNLYGLDCDLESIRYLKSRATGYFLKGDGCAIPYKDDSFDTVLSTSVMEHIEDDKRLIEEMTRVCKNKGQLIISVPSKEGLRSFSKLRNLGHNDPANPEFHLRIGYSRDELVSLLEKFDIRVEQVRYSLVLTAELAMDIAKWFYFKQNKLDSQSNISMAVDSPLFLIYKAVFPLVLFADYLERRLLTRWLKGHIITLRGRAIKTGRI